MKILVLGAGSIGSRHARNASGLAEVIVYDPDLQRAEEVQGENVNICTSLEAALALSPRAAIVATPSDTHVELAAKLLEAGCHVLVEKPMTVDVDDANRLLKRARKTGKKLFVAANMRFHPGPSLLKKYLPDIGEIRFARAHFGQWLPGMRSKVDYRELYCAKGKGAGVILDTIHEFDYLQWLLGPITGVMADTAHLSELEIEAEDYAAINLLHESGVRSSIQLDYLRRFKRRGCEIVGSDASLLWQSEGNRPETCRVLLLDPGHNTPRVLFECEDLDSNEMYLVQLKHFIEAARDGDAGDLLDAESATRQIDFALRARAQAFQDLPA